MKIYDKEIYMKTEKIKSNFNGYFMFCFWICCWVYSNKP